MSYIIRAICVNCTMKFYNDYAWHCNFCKWLHVANVNQLDHMHVLYLHLAENLMSLHSFICCIHVIQSLYVHTYTGQYFSS